MKDALKIKIVIVSGLTLLGVVYLFLCNWCPLLCSINSDNKTEWILFWIGLGASLMASLLATDQNDRLKNSTFGGLIGTGLSALVTIVQKPGNIDFIMYSVFGSVVGTFIGWLVYLAIAIMSYWKYNSPIQLIELITDGLKGVKEQIVAKENESLLTNPQIMWKQFAYDFEKIVNCLIATDLEKENGNMITVPVTASLLASICKVYNLMFKTNTMRASIIKFCDKKDGYHWISYYDERTPFDKGKYFNDKSLAYLLIKENKGRYRYVVNAPSDTSMQSRSNHGNVYKAFCLFKIDNGHVLTMDWPNELTEQNQDFIKDNFFSERIIDNLAKLFAKYDSDDDKTASGKGSEPAKPDKESSE